MCTTVHCCSCWVIAGSMLCFTTQQLLGHCWVNAVFHDPAIAGSLLGPVQRCVDGCETHGSRKADGAAKTRYTQWIEHLPHDQRDDYSSASVEKLLYSFGQSITDRFVPQTERQKQSTAARLVPVRRHRKRLLHTGHSSAFKDWAMASPDHRSQGTCRCVCTHARCLTVPSHVIRPNPPL